MVTGMAKTNMEMKLNLPIKTVGGWGFVLSFLVFVICVIPTPSQAYYGDSCSQYGIFAYEIGGYCKCTSGYVFGTDVLGNKTCVSADSVCSDKYGYASRYDSLSGSCECNYGYSLHNQYGRTQCVSNSSICSDQIGIMSTYNSLSDSCECMSGYVIDGGQCKSGTSVCRARHGLYSSYTSYNNKCSCDDGYTLDDNNQCVEKQNNVYFKLVDLDTDNRQAIVKSDYDSRQYLVSYGVGCLSSAFERYRYKRLVINLGTDYDLDRWDTIVLQDDDQTCSITSRERTYEDALETEEEDYSYYYVPTTPAYTAPAVAPTPVKTAAPAPAAVSSSDFEVPVGDIKSFSQKRILSSSAAFRKCPSTQCSIIRYYAEGSELNVTGQYSKAEWYRVDGTTDAGGTGQKITGWIHQSLFTSAADKSSSVVNDTSATSSPAQEKTPGFFGKLWGGFLGWFKR